jgi:hypothetical protein
MGLLAVRFKMRAERPEYALARKRLKTTGVLQ